MIHSSTAAVAAAALAYLAVQDADLTGRWVNSSQSVVMVVAPCGAVLCGTVEWASEKAKSDARRGTEQLVGTQLLTDLKQSAPGKWKGMLFVPDAQIRAPAKIELLSAEQLRVSGCVGRTKLCKSQLWSRTTTVSQP